MSKSLLIIEDEKLLAIELARLFQRDGWHTSIMPDIASARKFLFESGKDPLVIIADMNLPDGNSLDLLEEVRGKRGAETGEWVFLTAYGSIQDSMRAVRLGAFDFLEKPYDEGRLEIVINGAARSARAQRQLRDVTSARSAQHGVEQFLGHSTIAQETRQLLSDLTKVPLSALVISGETGTGKGLAARILHHNGSRRDGPLIELNCAALPRDLMESELFGHEPGAFTGAKGRRRGLFEQADQGTLFLDEIGELDIELQAKLLKAIEDKAVRRLGGQQTINVDVQIIAATNRDLREETREGRFRSDLYHRLGVFHMRLPTLGERIEDLDQLVPALIAEFNGIARKNVSFVSEEVWEQLRRHQWPGNVRELRNVLERCVLLSTGAELPARWLQLGPLDPPEQRAQITGNTISLPLDGTMRLDDMERFIIATALERNRHNVAATARALGTTRQTLRYRIHKHGLFRTGAGPVDQPRAVSAEAPAEVS